MRTTLDTEDDVLAAGFRPFGAANPKLVTNEQIDQLREHCPDGSRACDAKSRPLLDGAGT
jgi:hypothetical protein